MALTPKQAQFCKEYIVDLNATQAYIRAGYSARSAEVESFKALRIPKIKAEIQRLMEIRSKKVELTAESVLEEIKKVAFLDIREGFNDDGTMKQPKDWSDDFAKGVTSLKARIEKVAGSDDEFAEIKELRTNDKLRALELCGKHLKLFTDKVEHSGEINVNTIMERLQGKKQ